GRQCRDAAVESLSLGLERQRLGVAARERLFERVTVARLRELLDQRIRVSGHRPIIRRLPRSGMGRPAHLGGRPVPVDDSRPDANNLPPCVASPASRSWPPAWPAFLCPRRPRCTPTMPTWPRAWQKRSPSRTPA